MHETRTAAHRGERKEHLIPKHATIETPRIEPRRLQRAHVDTARAQRDGEIPLIAADPGRRADRKLGIERDRYDDKPPSCARASPARASALVGTTSRARS
jgi:hypothetical protein